MSKLYRGVDISLYQGTPDFAAVRDSGIDFVIFKASQGRTADYDAPFVDPRFRENVRRFAETPGRIYGGSYHYLMARNCTEAEREAAFYIDTIKPYRYNLQLWAALDVEDASLGQNAAELSEIVRIFCDRVKAVGFRPMVYASSWWLDNRFSVPAGVPIWEANWSRLDIPARARMWQSGTTRVPGIAGEVDSNLAYDIMGDANGDGEVNARDVTALMKHVAGGRKSAINESQCDFDRDGRINARDVIALMRAAL